jgi:hypothetical protein
MRGPMVPAGPVRTHVQNLVNAGMTKAAICRAAGTSSAYLSALLYGNYDPARTPMRETGAPVAARLLAVEYVPPAAPTPKPDGPLCIPSGFDPVGYRVGRCADCGQVAPVQVRSGVEVMFSHPRAQGGIQGLPPAAGPHPDCGHNTGVGRHRREGTELCGPCRNVQRGYDAGYKAAMTRAAREARSAIPRPLAEAVVKACRAFHYRRPVPQFQELARTVVQIADAELYGNEKCEAVEEEMLHVA